MRTIGLIGLCAGIEIGIILSAVMMGMNGVSPDTGLGGRIFAGTLWLIVSNMGGLLLGAFALDDGDAGLSIVIVGVIGWAIIGFATVWWIGVAGAIVIILSGGVYLFGPENDSRRAVNTRSDT